MSKSALTAALEAAYPPCVDCGCRMGNKVCKHCGGAICHFCEPSWFQGTLGHFGQCPKIPAERLAELRHAASWADRIPEAQP